MRRAFDYEIAWPSRHRISIASTVTTPRLRQPLVDQLQRLVVHTRHGH
jgi:hypothetical protein